MIGSGKAFQGQAFRSAAGIIGANSILARTGVFTIDPSARVLRALPRQEPSYGTDWELWKTVSGCQPGVAPTIIPETFTGCILLKRNHLHAPIEAAAPAVGHEIAHT
jgi:hypothetical protein